MTDISTWSSFVAGLLTFFTPCILPVVPLYLGYLGLGSDFEAKKQKYVVNTAFFCLGFSLVFILMGATASSLGSVLSEYRHLIKMVLGVLLVILGMHLLDVFRIPFLLRQARASGPSKISGPPSALLFGVAFGAGWTPCVGPILAGVLGLAASSETIWVGVKLLLLYSLGLSIPFLIFALLFEEMSPLLQRIKKYTPMIEKVSGLLVFQVGALLLGVHRLVPFS